MAQFLKKTYLHITMGSTGEATDQDMLSLDCHPIQPRLLGQCRFKPCIWSVLVIRLHVGDLNSVVWVWVP